MADVILKEVMERRDFIRLATLAGVGLLLPGCGSGGSSKGVLALTAPTRPVATGSLAQQVNIFSQSVEDMSAIFNGPSATISGFSLINQSRASRADTSLNGFQIAAQTTAAYIMAVAMYERLCQSLIALDNVGYLSTTITQQFTLKGAASVQNPQWHATMHLRLIALMRGYADLLPAYQALGAKSFATAIPTITDSIAQQAMYGIFAEGFNTWVTTVYTNNKQTVPANTLLDLSANMTAERIPNETARVAEIVINLPLAPSYRPVSRSVRSRDTETSEKTSGGEILVETAKTAGDTFFGTLIRPFADAGTTIYQNLQVLANEGGGFFIRNETTVIQFFEKQPFLSKLAEKGFENFKTAAGLLALKEALGEIYGKVGTAVGSCFAAGYGAGMAFGDIAGALVVGEEGVGALTAIALGSNPIGWGVAALGAAGLAAIAVSNLYDCYNDVGKARHNPDRLTEAQKELEQDGQTPTRMVPAFTNPTRAECDQLSRAGVQQKTLTPFSDGLPPLGSMDVQTARNLLYGAGQASLPRTYDNVDQAARELLNDYVNRHKDVNTPTTDGQNLNFFGSDFSTLVRREAGSGGATVPAITSAQLLCTGVGFVPSRSDKPVDLTTSGFPTLSPLTELGTGVQINAK